MSKSDAVKAGEFFADLLESDPEFRAGVEPAIAALKAEFDRLRPEYADVWQRMEADWETKFGEPYPKTIQDWAGYAMRAGVPIEWLKELKKGRIVYRRTWDPIRDLRGTIEAYLQGLRDQCKSDGIATRGQGEAGRDPLLTHVELATRYHLKDDTARNRLNRWRKKNDAGWHEASDTRPNEPKYLYRLSAVRHIFE